MSFVVIREFYFWLWLSRFCLLPSLALSCTLSFSLFYAVQWRLGEASSSRWIQLRDGPRERRRNSIIDLSWSSREACFGIFLDFFPVGRLMWFLKVPCCLYCFPCSLFDVALICRFWVRGTFWSHGLCFCLLVHSKWAHYFCVSDVCSVTRPDVVEVPLLYNTFRLLGRAFDGVSNRNSQRESDTICNDELQRKYADIEERRFVGSFPPTPTTFTSPDIAFDKTLSASHHPSYPLTYQTFLEADPATVPFPTTISGLGYFDDATELSIYSNLSPSEQTNRPAVVASLVPRLRPPRTPPRSRTSSSIPYHTPMRRTLSSAQDGRSYSPLTTPEPTYRVPFKFFWVARCLLVTIRFISSFLLDCYFASIVWRVLIYSRDVLHSVVG